MWHEARRQEKKIRGLMVDLKRRADRRREFYEKIKQDPTQFLRMYGRPVKIHLDPAVSMAAEGPQSMMSWQGDSANMIDRFDVRANLDYISEYNPNKPVSSKKVTDEYEERLASYERYRTLVENEAAGLTEEQCLHQIYLDEHFGTINKSNEEEKKKNADKKAAIGYVYEDSTPAEPKESIENSEEESDDDLDMADLDVTIDVDALTPDLCKEVNLIAGQYGMVDDDFIRLLRKDKEELEALKEARQLEEAKAQFSGRKSRRERRAINEKRQNPQRFCRPSYAARDSPKYEPYKRPGSSSRSRSRSRSRSSEKVEVKFITSFGNESDEEGGIVQGPALPSNVIGKKKNSESSKCETPWLTKSDTGHSRGEFKRSRSRSQSFRRKRSRRSSSSRSSMSRSRSRSRSSPRHRQSPRRSYGRSDSRKRSSSSSSSRSRSRSKTPPSARKESKRSRSKSVDKLPVKRYRRESLSSSSGLSDLESDDDNKSSHSSLSKSKPDQVKANLATGGKLISKSISQGPKETPQEKLKRRMQAQINKQFRADKKAEISKISKQEQERLDREEEIKTMAIEMRRRERERRHKEREEEEVERRARRNQRHGSSSSSRSRSRSRSSSGSSKVSSKSSSPDRSRSPPPRKASPTKLEDSRDSRRSDGDRDRRRDGRGGGGGDGKRFEGRGRMDGTDRDRKKRESDGWESRRESTGGGGRNYDGRGGGPDGDAGYSDRMSRNTPSNRGGGHWDSDRRSDGGRDDRRGWRDRDDRNNYGGSPSRWSSRPDPSSSSQSRRRPLLHRPDSPPPRSRYHPRD